MIDDRAITGADITKKQKLLETLYACQDAFEQILGVDNDSRHYCSVCALIKRLETDLSNSQDLV